VVFIQKYKNYKVKQIEYRNNNFCITHRLTIALGKIRAIRYICKKITIKMLKRFISIIALTIILSSFTENNFRSIDKIEERIIINAGLSPEQQKQIQIIDSKIIGLYNQFISNENIEFEVFKHAYLGYNNLMRKNLLRNDSLLTIVDFSKPSSEKRLFTFDLKNNKVIYKEYVSHGVNSGSLFAESFSNKPGSQKSSLGFYITNETYFGSNGYSLKLDGLEKDINDNARIRGIVIHGANYVDSIFILQNNNRLGRSFGCPALPMQSYKQIIETIKDKSCFFIYAPVKNYFQTSVFLNPLTNGHLNS